MLKNKKLIIVAILSIGIGLTAGFLFFGNNTSKESEHRHNESEDVGETIWTCSMHPQVKQPDPGDCPICGMDLIPLDNEDEDDSDPLAIKMSPTAMKLASIRTVIVGTDDAFKSLRLNGKVAPDERNVFSQSSHISGRIEQLAVNFTGEFVKEGQTVAHIYSPELVTAQEELILAKQMQETNPGMLNSVIDKLKKWKLTQKQIDEIIQSEEIKEIFPIKSDVSGYVLNKSVSLGDYISRGESIYDIVDLSKVWVLLDVYESDLQWVNIGSKVKYTVNSIPGKTFEGTIKFIDPIINHRTRVAKARIEVSNTKMKLKPDMFVSATIESNLKTKSENIIIPKTAVLWTGKRSIVYVKAETKTGVYFNMREVTLGASLGESYIIDEGLSEGDEIAVNGVFSIDAAAQLSGKPSMMAPEGTSGFSGHNHGDIEMQSTDAEIISKAKLSADASSELQSLFVEYFHLKEFLAEDDFENAKKSGIKMHKVLNEVNMAAFKGESHNIWMEYYSDLQKSLEHTGHHKNIEVLRESFENISIIMIKIAKSFEPLDIIIYVQHCPMAFNDKGANWLSKDETIKNPYFGASMLKCGEVIEKIEKK